jgi:hypothetical protein
MGKLAAKGWFVKVVAHPVGSTTTSETVYAVGWANASDAERAVEQQLHGGSDDVVKAMREMTGSEIAANKLENLQVKIAA